MQVSISPGDAFANVCARLAGIEPGSRPGITKKKSTASALHVSPIPTGGQGDAA
jgi:hypothetical protein